MKKTFLSTLANEAAISRAGSGFLAVSRQRFSHRILSFQVRR